jgi:hypothetical protein
MNFKINKGLGFGFWVAALLATFVRFFGRRSEAKPKGPSDPDTGMRIKLPELGGARGPERRLK